MSLIRTENWINRAVQNIKQRHVDAFRTIFSGTQNFIFMKSASKNVAIMMLKFEVPLDIITLYM